MREMKYIRSDRIDLATNLNCIAQNDVQGLELSTDISSNPLLRKERHGGRENKILDYVLKLFFECLYAWGVLWYGKLRCCNIRGCGE